ncbi:hypothetical protein QYF36_022672 [Acer negundo]|nr:hypothetical protein QYF36_022672 [Acer negundo]
MKEKFSGEEAEDRAAELCGLWETYLRDPSWHPYRVVADDLNSETFKEIIDEEDERLKGLKTEGGKRGCVCVSYAQAIVGGDGALTVQISLFQMLLCEDCVTSTP